MISQVKYQYFLIKKIKFSPNAQILQYFKKKVYYKNTGIEGFPVLVIPGSVRALEIMKHLMVFGGAIYIENLKLNLNHMIFKLEAPAPLIESYFLVPRD